MRPFDCIAAFGSFGLVDTNSKISDFAVFKLSLLADLSGTLFINSVPRSLIFCNLDAAYSRTKLPLSS